MGKEQFTLSSISYWYLSAFLALDTEIICDYFLNIENNTWASYFWLKCMEPR